ncbi:putative membrane protein [Bradyrhizobium sp. GM2.2]|uniref:COG4280 domain-containing protein n=1 Tax=Bradyrhizobium sp. GM2.2 TaxID=3156358 RepID=UPI003399FD54
MKLAWPIVTAAFLASLVEAVEALTIVLAVVTIRGWRPAAIGLCALSGLVVLFGPALDQIPVHLLQFIIGVLLLLFGLRWLRKAILRAAGLIPLHDEEAAFAAETSQLQVLVVRQARQDRVTDGFQGGSAEGLEVVFVVIALGTEKGMFASAAAGAIAACRVVLLLGLAIHRPLARVPENALKFVVGVLLSAFGVLWTGEALGIAWPGSDFAIIAFALVFLGAGCVTVVLGRCPDPRASA